MPQRTLYRRDFYAVIKQHVFSFSKVYPASDLNCYFKKATFLLIALYPNIHLAVSRVTSDQYIIPR